MNNISLGLHKTYRNDTVVWRKWQKGSIPLNFINAGLQSAVAHVQNQELDLGYRTRKRKHDSNIVSECQ